MRQGLTAGVFGFPALLLLCELALAGCGPRPLPEARVVDPGRPVVLPIRDPLGKPAFEVEVDVRGPARSRRLWMMIDSGLTAVSVPEALAGELALRRAGTAQVVALGKTIRQRAVLGTLGFDALAVENAVITLSEDLSVVGQSVLRHAPWEVSWSRGTLTLNAEPWAPGEAAFSLPLSPRDEYAVDDVQVRLNGRRHRMLFDTGALVSALPSRWGEGLGLDSEPFDGRGFAGAGGRVGVTRAFLAELGFGPMRFDAQRLLALPRGDISLLGLDVLSRFDFLVVPGKEILFRPKRAVAGTAAERVARWGWLPKCPRVGCMAGLLVPGEEKAELRLDVEAPLARATSVTLVCGEAGAPRPEPSTLASLMTAGPFRPPFRRVVARLPRGAAGRYALPVPRADRFWFSPDGSGCRELRVLDVVPEPPARARERPRALLLP